jgi:uncharacterized membrane protein
MPPIASPIPGVVDSPVLSREPMAQAPAPIDKATYSGRDSSQSTLPPVNTVATPVHSGRGVLDWENLIGGKWALWVGLISLFLASASFLAYTWRSLPPPPPGVRVAMGLALGVAFLLAGGYLRKRTQRWYSEGLFGIGLSILYLSLWAGAQYFEVLPFGLTFGLMALTTALCVFLAVRFDALSLSTLATLGGFMTPLLLSSGGQGSPVGLLTYVTVLNGGILGVSLFKRWRILTWLSFAATFLLVGNSSFGASSATYEQLNFAFLTVLFGLFSGASCFYSLVRREATAPEDLLLLFVTTSAYALGGFVLIGKSLGAIAGIFFAILAFFFVLLSILVRRLAPDNLTLRYSCGGLGLLFLTVAVPVQLQFKWLAIGWCMEAGILLLLSNRFRSMLLQRAGQIVWLLSFIPLLGTMNTTAATSRVLFLNQQALPLLVGVIVAAILTLQSALGFWSNHTPSQTQWDDELQPGYAAFAVSGGAWLLAQETYRGVEWQLPGVNSGAFFMIACVWSVYAVLTFLLGQKLRNGTVRRMALFVAVGAALLPFWTSYDLNTNAWTPFWNLRWLSMAVVGLGLATIGWLQFQARKTNGPVGTEFDDWWPSLVSVFVWAATTLEVLFSHAQGKSLSSVFWQVPTGYVLATLWSVLALAIFALGWWWNQPRMRHLAAYMGSGGVGMLLIDALQPQTTAFDFWRILSFVVVGTVTSLAARTSRRFDDRAWASTLGVLGVFLLVWGLTQQLYLASWHFRITLGSQWGTASLFLITLLWQGMAKVLWERGQRRAQQEYRTFAYALGLLGFMLLLFGALHSLQLGWAPLVNLRWVAFVAATIQSAFLLRALQQRSGLADWEKKLARYISLFAVTLLWWGLTQEAYEACYYWRATFGEHWLRWAQMSISLVWSLYGALLLIGGIQRRLQPLRLMALGLLAMTVLKVFLFDLSFLDASLRILSLGGLGAALVFISWLYSRFATPALANTK